MDVVVLVLLVVIDQIHYHKDVHWSDRNHNEHSQEKYIDIEFRQRFSSQCIEFYQYKRNHRDPNYMWNQKTAWDNFFYTFIQQYHPKWILHYKMLRSNIATTMLIIEIISSCTDFFEFTDTFTSIYIKHITMCTLFIQGTNAIT